MAQKHKRNQSGQDTWFRISKVGLCFSFASFNLKVFAVASIHKPSEAAGIPVHIPLEAASTPVHSAFFVITHCILFLLESSTLVLFATARILPCFVLILQLTA